VFCDLVAEWDICSPSGNGETQTARYHIISFKKRGRESFGEGLDQKHRGPPGTGCITRRKREVEDTTARPCSFRKRILLLKGKKLPKRGGGLRIRLIRTRAVKGKVERKREGRSRRRPHKEGGE